MRIVLGQSIATTASTTMTKELLHSLEFIDQAEYIDADYPSDVYTIQAPTDIPVPRKGETVEFGWHESDGERVERVHYNATYTGDAEYVRSKLYTVVDVKHHYHHARHTDDSGSLVTDRIEVGTEVIVQPVEEDSDDRE